MVSKKRKDMSIIRCSGCHKVLGHAEDLEMYIHCECGLDITNGEGWDNSEPLEEEPQWREWLNQMTANQAAYHKR
jgi:hypothetical protein